MSDREAVRSWLVLLRAPTIGAAALRAAMTRHGGATHALAAMRRDASIAVEARQWIAAPDQSRLDEDEAWLAADGHHLVTCDSPDYPALLRDIPGAPAALFVVGDLASLWLPQIAIVGARNASAGGIANARAFAKAFTDAGFAITSGLAEGIDGAAHRAALAAGGKTIAALGTGIDLVYPRRHAELAADIAANGALVSEFPPGTPAQPVFFPRRNRIISGLSLGTLVVEAGLKSGSLTTARYATEQGRDVFALPGSIHNPLARGCHRLIRDGARLVETAQEVLEELHALGGALADGLRKRLAVGQEGSQFAKGAGTTPQRDADYQRLLNILDDTPIALDDLAERSGLPAAALSSMLLVLELDGAVAAENGRYARTVG